MNREIKFRVWDSAAGMLTDITGFECSMGKVEGIFYDGDYIGIVDECRVLMQFTGVHDVNGKEIYEGDILQDLSLYPLPVVWDKESMGFVRKDYDDELYITQNCEVIGNVWENPELVSG